ncbi:MAG: hypothetical protein GY853_10105 [PVC group bacterium]|nr:hypothetical protein [PVC group bacterium]
MEIEITKEDILNLKNAEKKLLKNAEPYYDLEVFTIRHIIKAFEQKNNKEITMDTKAEIDYFEICLTNRDFDFCETCGKPLSQ